MKQQTNVPGRALGLASLLASATLIQSSQAAIFVDFEEVATGVRITVSGSANPTGLTQTTFGQAAPSGNARMEANDEVAMISPGPTPTIVPSPIASFQYTGAITHTIDDLTSVLFPQEMPELANLPFVCMNSVSGGGDLIIADVLLTGPDGGPTPASGLTYTTIITQNPLGGTAIPTFASLNLNDGAVATASWNGGAESVSFRIGSAVAVPEPSTTALLLPALCCLFRRKR